MTIGALQMFPTVLAKANRTKAASVEKEQGLFTALEDRGEFVGELPGNECCFVFLPFRVIGFTQINKTKFRKRSGTGTIREMEIAVFIFLTALIAFQGRCRRTEDDGCVLQPSPHHGQVTCIVAEAVFLL